MGSEMCIRDRVTSDRHAYVTAAASRLTAIIAVQGAPRTYLHSLGLYRADQDIILSSSAYGGQKTTRDALREGSERGHFRSSCVCHGGCLATDRYNSRAGRASDLPSQPGVVQSRSGHHKMIVTTLRSQTVYEPCLEGSRSPLPSVLSATSSSSPEVASCMQSHIQLSRRMRPSQLQDL